MKGKMGEVREVREVRVVREVGGGWGRLIAYRATSSNLP